MKRDLSKIVEAVYLTAFLLLFLWAGFAYILDHRLIHSFPHGYFASDAFQHAIRTDQIKDQANYRYVPSYSTGGVDGVGGYYPSLLHFDSAIIAKLTGIESYDAIYFVLILFIVLSPLAMYYFVKRVNKKIAILTLPFSLLIFSKGTYVGTLWGYWPTLVSLFLMILCMIVLNLAKDFRDAGLLAVLILGTIFAHFSESIFLIILIVFNAAYLWFSNRNDYINYLKIIFTSFIATAITSFYFLKMYLATWIKASPYSLSVLTNPGMPAFYISDFKVFIIFLVVGLLYGVYIILMRHNNFLVFSSIIFLILGLGNYFGFNVRAFYLRFYWPILISPLIAYGIYILLSSIRLDNQKVCYLVCLVIIPLFFSGLNFVPQYQAVPSSGLMDSETWGAFDWLRTNTQLDAKILFFYGDVYDQTTVLLNTKRLTYKVDREDYILKLKDGRFPEKIKTNVAFMDIVFSQQSFFEYTPEVIPDLGVVDTCYFDFYVFNKFARVSQLAQFNLLIRDFLLKNQTGFRLVYDTPYISILSNDNPRLNCTWSNHDG